LGEKETMEFRLYKMTPMGKVATLNLCVLGCALGIPSLAFRLCPTLSSSPLGRAIEYIGIAFFQLCTLPIGPIAVVFTPPFAAEERFAPVTYATLVFVLNAYLWGWAWQRLRHKGESPNNSLHVSG
jgi:hypothetical protein